MTDRRERAMKPEDITRLIVERVNAGDAEGAAALYEQDAVLDFPMGHQTVGRAAIQKAYEMLIQKGVPFGKEEPLPTVQSGDIALTSTHPADEAGARVQVARRQADGSWLRVLDRPELVGK
jgi:ketosteroid isomerase-like protein